MYPPRLKWYDYRWRGCYFVTIVSADRSRSFARQSGYSLELTAAGRIIDATWAEIPGHFRHVTVDAFVVMPDHVHGIVVLHGMPRTPSRQNLVAAGSLSAIVRSFKSASTRRINAARGLAVPVWQYRYYDSIIRDREHLRNVRRYIANNPRKWIRAHGGDRGCVHGSGCGRSDAAPATSDFTDPS